MLNMQIQSNLPHDTFATRNALTYIKVRDRVLHAGVGRGTNLLSATFCSRPDGNAQCEPSCPHSPHTAPLPMPRHMRRSSSCVTTCAQSSTLCWSLPSPSSVTCSSRPRCGLHGSQLGATCKAACYRLYATDLFAADRLYRPSTLVRRSTCSLLLCPSSCKHEAFYLPCTGHITCLELHAALVHSYSRTATPAAQLPSLRPLVLFTVTDGGAAGQVLPRCA